MRDYVADWDALKATDPEVAAALSDELNRERSMLRLIASGLPNHAIATKLSLSFHTVKNHVQNIFKKIDVTRRTEAVERARVVPVIERLCGLAAVLSVDTTRAAVAEAALNAGARVINDISGGLDDPQMLPLAARRGAPIVLMHMRGEPATMQGMAEYRDVVAEVKGHLV